LKTEVMDRKMLAAPGKKNKGTQYLQKQRDDWR